MLAPALGLRTPYMGTGSSAPHAQTHEMIQGQLLVLLLHVSCVLGAHRFYGRLHGYGKARHEMASPRIYRLVERPDTLVSISMTRIPVNSSPEAPFAAVSERSGHFDEGRVEREIVPNRILEIHQSALKSGD